MARRQKTKMLNVRMSEKVHNDFKIACDLLGGSMSSIMHQFIVKTIRDQKDEDPAAFVRTNAITDDLLTIPSQVESDGIIGTRKNNVRRKA